MAWYFWLKFCMEYKWDLGVDWCPNEKKNYDKEQKNMSHTQNIGSHLMRYNHKNVSHTQDIGSHLTMR